MASGSTVVSLQNLNLSSVHGLLVAKAAVGARNDIAIKTKTHFMVASDATWSHAQHRLNDLEPEMVLGKKAVD
jgi:hypothetical protein